jgi:DHA1 family bicyclomycin/chloramphenicol resistance-like MFS transporter
VLFLAIAWSLEAGPPFWAMLCFLIAGFFPIGILFGNFNALAMQSLGHVAGMATTVIGSITTFASLSLGTLVGQAYDGTVLPLVAGFAILSTLSMLAFFYVRTGTR